MEIEENIPYDLNLYYQINNYDDIQDYKLKEIKKTPYFLIEAKNINPDKFSFDFIINLLQDDGVNLDLIKEYKYLIEDIKKDKTNIILKNLSDTIISQVKNKDLYLHLIVDEENDLSCESSENEDFKREIDVYKKKITEAEKNFEEISSGIKKGEVNSDKNCNDYYFKNIEKNAKQTFPESYQNYLSKSYIKFDENFLNIDESLSLDNIYKNVNTKKVIKSFKISKSEKKGINLSFLYSNPLVYTDHKKEYHDIDCFNEIVTIYNIFKESKESGNLIFEPINDNFNEYSESSPDIIHIRLNSSTTRGKLDIDLDYLGELQYDKCEKLKARFNTEYELSQIKLLILSTQNITRMKPIFNNIGIQNIIYIENKTKYPEPNEEEEFIKELYQNMIIKGFSIQESFKRSKNKLIDKVELYPLKNNNDIFIVKKNKENKNRKNADNKDNIRTSIQTALLFDNVKNNIKLNSNCSLNLDFVKYNYKRIIGRNVELKNCIDKLNKNCNVCVCGYPGAGKKSFIQTVGKFVFEHNMFQEVKFIEINYLRNAEETLINKKEEIKSNINTNNDNQLENNMIKILLIININFVITEENDAFILEEYINKIQDKQFSYLYAFSINEKLKFAQIKNKLRRTPMIELDKLQQEKRMNLYFSISSNLKTKYNFKQQEEIIKKTNGYPNEIYLRTLYIKHFFKEVKNIDIDKLTNEVIFKKIFDQYGKRVIKIFSFFTNNSVIREDVLNIYFEKEEINLIKNELSFIIFCERDDKGKNYSLDSSFKGIIKELLNSDYKKSSDM